MAILFSFPKNYVSFHSMIFWGICDIIIKKRGEKYKLSNFVGKLSNKICKTQNVIENSKREEIEYGLEVIFSTFLSLTMVLAISLFYRMIKECITFLAVFMPLRTYTGGYHASTHVRCFFTLIIDMMAGALILYLYKTDIYIISWSMIIVATIIVVVFSPVVHINHPMSRRQQIMSKKKSIVILLIDIIVLLFMAFRKQQILLFSGAYGLASIAISMMIAKYIKKRGDSDEVKL